MRRNSKEPLTVRTAIDAYYVDMTEHPSLQDRVLRKLKGEPPMKRKISASLALAMVLVLAVVTALAVYSLRDTARLVAQTEQESGTFATWPIEKKTEVVLALLEQGHLPKTESLQALQAGMLTNETAGQTTDEAMELLTGSPTAEITFFSIMGAIWGPFDQWTHEERAWCSQLMEDVGIESDGKTFFVEPEDTIIDEATAISIARRATAERYGVSEATLDAYRCEVAFQVPEFADTHNDAPYWTVTFSAPDDMPESQRLFIQWPCFVNPVDGTVLMWPFGW